MGLVTIFTINILVSSFFGLRLFVFVFLWSFFSASAVLFDEFVQSVEVVKHVDSSASVQMRWFYEPQIVRVKVAERHRILLRCSLLKVESFKLRNLA